MNLVERLHEIFSYYVHVILFYFFRMWPVNRKKIVFSNFWGKGVGGILAKVQQNIRDCCDVDIVWTVDRNDCFVPGQIRKVRIGSLRYIYEMATAGIWIDNCRKADWVRKRKDQVYIQTWHGDVYIKMIEKDAVDSLPMTYIKSAQNDSKMMDYLVAGSEWQINNFKRAFWYNGEILKGDLYKQDLFLAKEKEKLIRENYKISSETKVALYVPTFRNSDNLESYDMDYKRIIEALETTTGMNWCLLIRLHPNQTHLSEQIDYDEKIINASKDVSVEELMGLAALVITDYSGCMFQAFKLRKKVILYASDYKEYLDNDRGMYFDITKLPAPFTQNNDELVAEIGGFNELQYFAKVDEFIATIGYYENDGVAVVVDTIKRILER